MKESSALDHDVWLPYSSFVIGRVEELVTQGIWSGISTSELDKWIAQFERRNARALAAILLDSLVYRSQDQFKSGLRYLFTHVPYENGVASLSLLESLKERNDEGIRVVPVLGLDNPPTKSGPYVLRIAERDLGLNDRWFDWGQRILEKSDRLKTIFFIDDFCGTGIQFKAFLENTVQVNEILKTNPKIRLVYLVGALHSKGEQELKDSFPSLEIFAAERLGSELDFFENNFEWCPDVSNKKQLIKQEYDRFVSELDFPKMKKFALNLCFGFEHSTPNNSLPVFWCQNKYWEPLLCR